MGSYRSVLGHTTQAAENANFLQCFTKESYKTILLNKNRFDPRQKNVDKPCGTRATQKTTK